MQGRECLTNNLDLQIKPMKLLDWATRTASLIDIDLCPLLLCLLIEVENACDDAVDKVPGSLPISKSLQRSTGSTV
jgi:hypothetical protein